MNFLFYPVKWMKEFQGASQKIYFFLNKNLSVPLQKYNPSKTMKVKGWDRDETYDCEGPALGEGVGQG